MAVVERATARKALNLHHDPDRSEDTFSQFWKAVEEAIRMAELPFRSVQATPKENFVLWDASRLVRLVFSIAAGNGSLAGAVASTPEITRRSTMLPFIARRLQSSRVHSAKGFELDDDGLVATLHEFDAHNEDCWPKGFRFVTDYLTSVRQGVYDARAPPSEKARANLSSAPSPRQ